MLSASIQAKVHKLWDALWSGGIANPLMAVEQISYLLFLRRLDELDRANKAKAKFTGRPYKSVFAGREKDNLRWSQFKQMEAGQMLAHVRDIVFPFIKEELASEDEHFARHMKDAVFVIPKPSLLAQAVAILDEIYAEIEKEQQEGQTFHDVQGDIYELFLSEISQSGTNGQFRTPRHVIQAIVELVGPRLGERVCDPACGTGGFLLAAYQHVLAQHTTAAHRTTDRQGIVHGTLGDKLTDERQWKVLRSSSFYGFDFDTSMVRIGLMNLLLHGLDQPNIDYKDTLSKSYTEANAYDVVLANPPFKGSIDKGDINEELRLPTTKTELLFVNRMINMLKIGGRCGVIVPDGVLFSSSKAHQALRQMLMEECELQAVVSLPAGVFRPYAGVSTGVLVFVKGGRTENVWFYDLEADGYSLDDKRNPVTGTDIPDLLKRWKQRNPEKDTDRTAKAFFVPTAEIKANAWDLSLNRYKKVVHQEVQHEPPKVILAKLRDLEKDIMRDLDELERMLEE